MFGFKEPRSTDCPLFFAYVDDLHGVPLLNRVDDILPFQDFAEDAMDTVQVRSGDMRNEKLGAIGVGSGVGHGEDAGTVMPEVFVELILKLVSGAAGTGSLGATGLDHEIR